jgi:hypothetical protein
MDSPPELTVDAFIDADTLRESAAISLIRETELKMRDVKIFVLKHIKIHVNTTKLPKSPNQLKNPS